MIDTDKLMLPKKTVETLETWTKRGAWNGPNGVKPDAGGGEDIDDDELDEELLLLAPEASQINEQPPLPIVLVKLELTEAPKIAVKVV